MAPPKPGNSITSDAARVCRLISADGYSQGHGESARRAELFCITGYLGWIAPAPGLTVESDIDHQTRLFHGPLLLVKGYDTAPHDNVVQRCQVALTCEPGPFSDFPQDRSGPGNVEEGSRQRIELVSENDPGEQASYYTGHVHMVSKPTAFLLRLPYSHLVLRSSQCMRYRCSIFSQSWVSLQRSTQRIITHSRQLNATQQGVFPSQRQT
jgi:hypothetical protein